MDESNAPVGGTTDTGSPAEAENADLAAVPADNGADDSDVNIVAPVTPWFFKRCALLALLLGGVALYFCYDGFLGYPSQNRNADIYDAFMAGKDGTTRALGASAIGNDAAERAFLAGRDRQSWAAFAASLHLPAEPPKRHTAADIRTQKRIALALGLATLAILFWALVHRSRAWRMKGAEIESPWRTRLKAEDVADVDLRRWDRGMALLICKNGVKLKLDDYKYHRAERIVEAIRDNHPEVRIDPPLPEKEGSVDDPNDAQNGHSGA